MGKKKSVEPKNFHVWQCQACAEQYETESKNQMAEHLLVVHGVDVKTEPTERRSTFHLDGADYYENHYLLIIGGVEILEAAGGAREADSMMR